MRHPFNRRTVLLGLTLLAPWITTAEEVEKKRIPYGLFLSPETLTVVATFDGSYGLGRWKEITNFADRNQIRFTFFVSGVYYLPSKEKGRYHVPPEFQRRGKSNIGFGGTEQEVALRKAATLDALAKGHDVESHLNGHFNGVEWSRSAWQRELEQFRDFCDFLPEPARHVRFPYLAMNRNVYGAMRETGVRSIVSVISPHPHYANQVTLRTGGETTTLLEFPIDYVRKRDTYVPLMDYAFFEVDQRLGLSRDTVLKDTVEIYRDHAKRCLLERRPFFLTQHFAKMNGDVYWDAAKQVLVELSKTYTVEYLTVAQLHQRIMDGLDDPNIASAIAQAQASLAPYTAAPPGFIAADDDLLSSFWPLNIAVAFQGWTSDPASIWKIRLTRAQGDLSGKVMYRDGHEAAVKGRIDPQGRFDIQEIATAKRPAARLRGRLVAPDRMTGSWTPRDGSQPRTFTLNRLMNPARYDTAGEGSERPPRRLTSIPPKADLGSRDTKTDWGSLK